MSADVFLWKIIDERQISRCRWGYRNLRQENQWLGQVGNKVFAKISVEFLWSIINDYVIPRLDIGINDTSVGKHNRQENRQLCQ